MIWLDKLVGSQKEKAENTASELNQILGTDTITGMQNEDAALRADINVLTVVAKAHQSAVTGLKDVLQGKIAQNIGPGRSVFVTKVLSHFLYV